MEASMAGQERRSALLPAVVPILLQQQPELLPFFLLESNHKLSNIAAQYAYRRLDLVFDTGVAVHNALKLKLASVLSNERYANSVLELHVSHSTKTGPECPSQSPTDAQAQGWSLAASIIKSCPQLLALEWRAAFGIGGDVWDAISDSIHLRKLSILPPWTHAARQDVKTPRATPRQSSTSDCRQGWELGDVWNGLQELELTGLTAIGTKALAAHLRQLAQRTQQPPLAYLNVSTMFMDGPLCSAIGDVGRHGLLRRLDLSTSGSKLSTEVFIGLLESCVGLRELVLKDVRGRLDRDVWERIEYPETLRKLIIEIPEDGQHHSWTHAHLASIHHAPLSQLTHFAVYRLVPPLATLPRPPNVASLSIPVVNDFCHPKPITLELITALAESGSSIRSLSLDWWECSPSDVEQLARGCGKLQELQVMLDCPVSKLLALATPFSNLHELNRLTISVSTQNAKHPDSDLAAVAFRGSPTKTPECESPTGEPGLSRELARLLHAPDPTVPHIKDIRKFVRRLPRLTAINWEGRGGKGSWRVTRSVERRGGSDITFEHAAIRTLDLWREAQEMPPVWDFPEEVLSMSGVESLETLDGADSVSSPSSTVLATPLVRSGSTPALDALISPSSKSPSPHKPRRRLSLPDDADTAESRASVGLGLNISGRQTSTAKQRQGPSRSPTKPAKPAEPKSPERSNSPSPKKIVTANGWRMAGSTKKKPKAKE